MIDEEPLSSYYARRAGEYEEIYSKPERQPDLRQLSEMISAAFPKMDVLEVACGTGYWTRFIAGCAARIIATDICEEALENARGKDYGSCPVRFITADAYSLDGLPSGCTAGIHGFWWSHIPLQRIPDFLDAFHRHLPPGSPVMMIDNVYVDGNSTPVARRDEQGNTYQRRRLKDGSVHEVLKNFPTDADLFRSLAGRADDVEVKRLVYYWIASYKLRR